MNYRHILTRIALATGLAALPAAASAQEVIDPLMVVSDTGDTAWVLASTVLVLLMTLPGLALFYGGRAQAARALSVPVQCFAITATVSLLWAVVGFTLAFGPVSGGIVGSGLNWMLLNLGNIRAGTTVPESAFVLFQMMFAVVACALMVGAWVDRARLGWVVAFAALWSLIVYAPTAHWIWGGGWLGGLGVLDFAGGLVVHTAAGVSALVVAIMLGRRDDAVEHRAPSGNAIISLAGAAMLWVGWLGLIGGSALTATDDAAQAVVNAHVAAAAAAMVWAMVERWREGASSGIGIATGAIAGLAAISPAAGFIGTGASILIGGLGGAACYFALGLVKNGFAIDDRLNVFAVHGVGGALGSLLLALFIGADFGGIGHFGDMAFGSQFVAQLIGVGAVAIWSAVATFIIGFGISFVLPMRASVYNETQGFDSAHHSKQTWQVE